MRYSERLIRFDVLLRARQLRSLQPREGIRRYSMKLLCRAACAALLLLTGISLAESTPRPPTESICPVSPCSVTPAGRTWDDAGLGCVGLGSGCGIPV